MADTQKPKTVAAEVAAIRKSGHSVDTLNDILFEAIAKVRADASEIPRVASIANAAGKIAKLNADRLVAFRIARVKPTHENMPYFIPEGAKEGIQK